MRKTFSFIVLSVVVLSLLLASCGNESTDAPDVSAVSVPYKSYPFYKDFSALKLNYMTTGLEQLKSKYPGFTDFFLDELAGFGIHGQYTDTNQMLNAFFSHKDYLGLMDTVNKAFPDTKELDKNLKATFQYIKHYDSSFMVPEKVYYFVSGLNGFAAVIQDEKTVGVGLDMFLGRDFDPYAAIGIPKYGTIKNTRENIPVWVSKAIYDDQYHFQYEDRNLLDMMIQKGKEQYFLQKVTPYLDDATRLGFTAAQLTWSKEHEAMVYNFFLQNKLLFENNLQKTMRFVSEGPNTPGMPAESPGNIGSFIGLRIVSAYMKNSGASLRELMQMTDAQKILEASQYKP